MKHLEEFVKRQKFQRNIFNGDDQWEGWVVTFLYCILTVYDFFNHKKKLSFPQKNGNCLAGRVQKFQQIFDEKWTRLSFSGKS